jgi:hypothetical protein
MDASGGVTLFGIVELGDGERLPGGLVWTLD